MGTESTGDGVSINLVGTQRPMTTAGYERMVELVAENPALEAEELVEKMKEEGFDIDDTRQWLEEALGAHDVMKFDDSHWVVRKGEYTFDEYDQPVN